LLNGSADEADESVGGQIAKGELSPMRATIPTTILCGLLGLASLALPGCTMLEEPVADPASKPRPVAAPAYQLGAEDLLEVHVWKEPELSTTATVRPDGRITLPLAGELVAAGKTVEELQAEIAAALGKYVEMPVVTVMVKAINSPQISVLGEVRRPGRYRIAQRATILDAIALGGGFTEFARRNEVVVLRQTGYGVRRIPVDVEGLLRDGRNPPALQSGDTVYVE
jgi:polysaccharide export outer membrane protein